MRAVNRAMIARIIGDLSHKPATQRLGNGRPVRKEQGAGDRSTLSRFAMNYRNPPEGGSLKVLHGRASVMASWTLSVQEYVRGGMHHV